MAELKEFKVTTAFKVTKQIRQYEPITIESRIEATYLAEDESEIEGKQALLQDKCFRDVANRLNASTEVE